MRALLSALVLASALAPGARAAVIDVELRDQNGAPIADAVVSLTPSDGTPLPAADEGREVEIEQRDGAFTPAMTVVRTGTRISFPNRDGIQHHVYSLSPAKRFDLPLHGNEERPAEIFDRPGVVAIGCNIHDWMRAHVVVVDTPWFAKTAADGRARVNAPEGAYRAEIWHHRQPKPTVVEVRLNEAAPVRIEQALTLRRERKPFRAAESAGEAYR